MKLPKPRLRVWMFLFSIALVALVFSWIVRESKKVYAPDIISVQSTVSLPGRPISGSRLVRPDGTVSLGYYGSVPVTGLPPDEIRQVVARHLRQWMPRTTVADISVSVVAINSRRSNLIDRWTGTQGFTR